jgi:hypothetical protein
MDVLVAAKKNGLKSIDLTPILAREPDQSKIWDMKVGHFTLKGNALVAKVALEAIQNY